MLHSTPSTNAHWWRNAAVYQIYPRSFADDNGDGIGDIAGMRKRLPYLAALGIDAIWVNPWYVSPLNDGGYDVADYRSIDPRYGDIGEAREFIAEARAVDIAVLVDLVPNHTSSEHRWFREALASPPGSPARQRYHFRPGHHDARRPPNNWWSNFGGSAWTRVPDGEWYLHIFDVSQPDLNWANPEVVEEFDDILRFWLDLGAAGFRVDVAHALTKDPGYPDLTDLTMRDGPTWIEGHPFWDRDDLHPIIRRWRAILDEYPNTMMVAEAWVRADRRPLYVRQDEYHQAFDFDLLTAPWRAAAFAEIISAAVTAASSVESSPTWVLSNHDVVRHSTRYGLDPAIDLETWPITGPVDALDQELGDRRARAAALITLGLPGSAYIYQGEELGLPEVWDLPFEVLDDPVFEGSGRTKKGRDGCRVPMPWDSSGPSLGFGSGDPWLPQPSVFADRSAAAQEHDPSSMLHLYRSALRLRRELLGADEHFALLDAGADVLAFERGRGVRCFANMGDSPVPLPPGDVLLASGALSGVLPGNTAIWLRAPEATA